MRKIIHSRDLKQAGLVQQRQKEEVRLFSLTAGGLKEAAQDAVVFQSLSERVPWMILRLMTTGDKPHPISGPRQGVTI